MKAKGEKTNLIRKTRNTLQNLSNTKALRRTLVLMPILLIILVAAFLRFDRLLSLMSFFGDQAWFYISAKDLILTHQIPLVGITSSHTWLHQGPLWTYMLAVVLFISNFNPLSGAVLTSFLGLLCVFLVYKIGSEFFSKSFGIIASVLFAVSPLVVVHSRMAYHTSPIPFFVLLLLYSVLKIIYGKPKYLLLVALCLSLLYNLELATVIFIPIVLLILFLGYYKKTQWFEKLKNRKIIIASILALIIPMIPILIYDFQNGFPQTIKYGAWFGYKFLVLLGFLKPHGPSDSFSHVISFFFIKYSLLILPSNIVVSIIAFFASLIFITLKSYKKILKPVGIIFLFTLVPVLALFVSKTASEAYLPMLFPGLIFTFALLLGSIYKKSKVVGIYVVAIIVVINSFFCIQIII